MAVSAILRAQEVQMPQVDHIVLWVEDQAAEAFYFTDPDGNLLEARWYA